MNELQEYEVNVGTMALLPYFDKYANLYTIVIEEREHFTVPRSPWKVIDDSCKYFGSSYVGRLNGVKEVMGISKKAPIAVSVELAIFFFPHESPSNHSCVWLSHSHIKKVKRREKKNTQIYFTNGKSIDVKASENSILSNLFRTAQYRHLLQKRHKTKKQSYTYALNEEAVSIVHDPSTQSYVINHPARKSRT